MHPVFPTLTQCAWRLALHAGDGSCLDSSLPGPGACSCKQMAVVCLACVGYAFPLACHFLAEAAARRNFLRK